MASHKRALLEIDEQQEERDELITQLERVTPQTELGARLLELRLQMLRAGQHLWTLDEINSELGRDDYADVH